VTVGTCIAPGYGIVNGLPPPQQAPETSAAASSSNGAEQVPKKRPLPPPQQAPETSAAASSSNGAEEAPKKRGRCTPATLVQDGVFIGCMERILESKHTTTTTNANLLKEALAASCASLCVQWTGAVLAPDFNDSFGEFLYSHVRQTMNLTPSQKVALGISLIQQQRGRTSEPC
jgi:hypothetical protein